MRVRRKLIWVKGLDVIFCHGIICTMWWENCVWDAPTREGLCQLLSMFSVITAISVGSTEASGRQQRFWSNCAYLQTNQGFSWLYSIKLFVSGCGHMLWIPIRIASLTEFICVPTTFLRSNTKKHQIIGVTLTYLGLLVLKQMFVHTES